MARYTDGPMGSFRGKVGPVVGSSWKGIPYLKSLPKKSKKEPTQKKRNSWNAFSFINTWLVPIHELVMIGFRDYDPHRTGRNSAHSYNSLNALIKSDEGFDIDYSKALFSLGNLPGAKIVSVMVAEDRSTLLFNWSTEVEGDAKASDGLMYLLYSPEKKSAEYGIGEYCRKDGTMELKLTDELGRGRIEIMIAFKSLTSNKVSTSQYAGCIRLDQLNEKKDVSTNTKDMVYCVPPVVNSLWLRV